MSQLIPGISDSLYPESNRPDSTNPGSTNLGSINPGSTNPGSTNPGSINPGSGYSGSGQPDLNNPINSRALNNRPEQTKVRFEPPAAELNHDYGTSHATAYGTQRASDVAKEAKVEQISSSATIDLQIWITNTPFKLTAAWSVVAAILSMGLIGGIGERIGALDWQTIALLLLLVDPLWGGLWRFAWGRDGILRFNNNEQGYRFWLPYLQPQSPAARLMGMYRANYGDAQQSAALGNELSGNELSGNQLSNAVVDDLTPLLFRIGVPTLLLTYGVSATLGTAAFWLTTCAVLCSLLGWLSRRTWGRPATIAQALMAVSLPWALAILLLYPDPFIWSFSNSRVVYSLLLMSFWTAHYWGINQFKRTQGKAESRYAPEQAGTYAVQWQGAETPGSLLDSYNPANATQTMSLGGKARDWLLGLVHMPSILLLLIADVGIMVLLLVLREPLWLAILCPLWLPTWLAYMQGNQPDRQPIWRIAALIVTAAAIGQAPLR